MPLFLDTHIVPANQRLVFGNDSSEEDANVFVIRKMLVDGHKCFCILRAPDAISVEQFHLHEGSKCEWIEEITSIDEFTLNPNV